MSSFPILDLVAGMIFIFFLLSIINNSLLEIIYSFTKARATMFRKWLESLFGSTVNNPSTQQAIPLWQALADHDTANGLSAPKKATNYMSAKDFSTALMDLLTANPRDKAHQDVQTASDRTDVNADAKKRDDQPVMIALPISLDNVEFALNNNLEILPESLRRIFLFYVSQARNLKTMPENRFTDVQLFSQQVEAWFDREMQLLGGRFKKFSLWYTLVAASIITLCLNIDSIQLMQYLYDHPAEAAALANAETATAYNPVANETMNDLNRQQSQLNAVTGDSLMMKNYAQAEDSIIANAQKRLAREKQSADSINPGIPLRWNEAAVNALGKKYESSSSFESYLYWIRDHFFGYLFTILAICLGAPFWFDVLGKVANLRSSIKPVSTAEQES